jgi:hypothetical protein
MTVLRVLDIVSFRVSAPKFDTTGRVARFIRRLEQHPTAVSTSIAGKKRFWHKIIAKGI